MSSYGTGCEMCIQPAAPGGSCSAVQPAQVPGGPTEMSREVSYTLYFQCREKVVAALRRMHLQKGSGFMHPYCGFLQRPRGLVADEFCPVQTMSPCRGRAPVQRHPSPRGGLAPGWPCQVRLLGRSPPSPPGAEANACLIRKTCLWTK